ncbi:MAG: hypothetical protein OXL68_19620 [Paracoccaceae bacterium]|nr:hypothetical protein [Paracoccaceae bacterium]
MAPNAGFPCQSAAATTGPSQVPGVIAGPRVGTGVYHMAGGAKAATGPMVQERQLIIVGESATQ